MDLLFLDGWKLLYLDVLKLLMPSLRQGAVVLADDVTLFPDDVATYFDLSVILPMALLRPRSHSGWNRVFGEAVRREAGEGSTGCHYVE